MNHSDSHFRFLLEHLGGAVVEVDDSLEIIWASDALTGLMGKEMDQIVGRSVALLADPRDRGLVGRDHRTGSPVSTIVIRCRLDNPLREVWAEIISQPTLTAGRRGGVAFLRDVTAEVASDRERDELKTSLTTLVQHSSDVVVRLDSAGHLVWASPSFEAEFGVPAQTAVGTHLATWVLPEDRHRIDDLLEAPGPEFSSSPTEFRVPRADGAPSWLQAKISEPIDQGHDRYERLVLLRNVTQEVRTREQVEASERRFRRVMHNSATGMAIIASDGRVIEANDAMGQILGMEPEAMHHLSSSILGARPESEEFARALADVARGDSEQAQGYVHLERPDGRPLRLHVSMAIVEHSDPERRTFVVQIIDMTKEREARAAAEYEATHDALTGLTNRRVLMDRLQEVLDSSDPEGGCALLYCDVDNMKLINDGLGHHVGDLALRALAHRLANVARHEDLVTRVGGDEFVLMFYGSGREEDWATIADRIVGEASEPMTIDDEEFSLSISAGLAVSESHDTVVHLMQRADAALYEAKRTGRNRWVAYSTRMRRATGRTIQLREELKRAIAQDEFIVEYQPIVSLSRGVVIAHEALVRWIHPTRGRLLPDEFIPVAESSGLIRQIDQIVFDRVLADLEADELSTPVSVNLSAVHLSDARAMDRIHDSLAEHPLLRHRIWMEVTETALPGLVDEALDQLERLHAAGARLVLDDFGTGFASLYYLAKAPISVIKIDHTLTGLEGVEGKASGLLKWISVLGKTLGVMVIAEGIEDEEQLRWLRAQDIDYGQGWALGRPSATR
jgi:diguanylate cyclase (GGDEF)-like protein/PAS domain S-box-containing protein